MSVYFRMYLIVRNFARSYYSDEYISNLCKLTNRPLASASPPLVTELLGTLVTIQSIINATLTMIPMYYHSLPNCLIWGLPKMTEQYLRL